ncbi:MAG: N-acetylmuramoyl-L-alanine amidase-like domain-containing protein [Thermodesulfovibrionaceae bacterium]
MIFNAGKINIDKLLNCVKLLNAVDRKIEFISEEFIGIPYKKNSLIGSVHKKEELVVDFEGVDCMTFIEYVEALRLSSDFYSFIENLKTVRYFDGVVDFNKRRHFFTDWNKLKTVKNITSELSKNIKGIIKEINKSKENLLVEGLDVKKRRINYIPLEFIEETIPKLKTGDYCGFYTSKMGLDVDHVGIIVIKKEKIILRHASSLKGFVTDEDFFDYIKSKKGIIVFRAKE